MDFTLSDNQQMYVDTVSRFVKNEIIPHVLELDRSHDFPLGCYHKGLGSRHFESEYTGIS